MLRKGTASMKYRQLGKTGLTVSEIALGGGMFSHGEQKDVEETCHIVRRALERGMNYIDTAPAYGQSEQTLGTALSGTNRPCILSTKFGGRPKPFNPQDKGALRSSFEESLRLLKRESIDILFIHEPDRPRQYEWFSDWDNFHGPVTDLLDELKSEKLVRFTGLAGTTSYEMARIIEKSDYDVVLTAFNYSLLWQEALISVVPAARKKNMGIVVGSPLQHGALARCYDDEIEHGAGWLSPPRRGQFKRLYALVRNLDMPLSELGIRFILSNSDVSSVLTGVRSVEELEENIRTVEAGPLPPSVLREIDAIAAMVPFRPYEEPYKLPFNTTYKGPGHIGKLQ
jgi:aryl-alcohol dehydrogenase-like predicted oxidoreductase